jgi:hypothetical protein
MFNDPAFRDQSQKGGIEDRGGYAPEPPLQFPFRKWTRPQNP